MEQEKLLQLRRMVFQDPDNDEWRWSAVALEVDLWGYGHTMEEAREHLQEAIEAQIEFADGRQEPHLIAHPAEGKWFRLWDEAQGRDKERLAKMLGASTETEDHSSTGSAKANRSYYFPLQVA